MFSKTKNQQNQKIENKKQGHSQSPENRTNSNQPVLKIIPLGGNEEVGRNMTVFEYKNDIVILDMGIQFPEEDMPGIDYIVPNVSYLQGKEKNIKAVIFSHGHLDHIGAAPILLPKIGNPPIIGRKLTLALVKDKLENHQKGSTKQLKTIPVNNTRAKIQLGNFNVSFFEVEHSIMDSMGVVIETPDVAVIHPGDWTLPKNSTGDRDAVSYEHLGKITKTKVLMLESLGATRSDKAKSEKEVYANLKKLIQEARGRVIIGTFSSQIERTKWILNLAEQLGKKVALDGYSMKKNIEIAKKLGYVKAHKETMIKIDQVNKYPENKVVVVCTGAQGESNAVFSRIINKNHRHIQIKKSDTVIFSSSVIPGNERTIQRLKDNLYRLSDNVIHSEIMDVHVSGHCNIEDIKEVLRQVKPDYFVPVYANHYFLKEAGKIAMSVGIDSRKIFVADNGQIMEFQGKQGRLTTKKVPTDYVMVDGLGIGDVSDIVLRDRQVMAGDGMIVIIATIHRQTGNLIGNPDIISRGFVYMKGSRGLIEETRSKAKKILHDRDPKTSADDMYIKKRIRDEIGKFLFKKTERRPMILPVIIEV